jgi:ATP-dependent metalloprotease FtsH
MFKLVAPDKNGVKFKDVVGHTEGKQDLLDCVKFFEHRDKYVETGYEIPKGLMLVGHPGTGKTLLAKAFANEANVNFISVCGSDFIELYVGVGSKRVRELFELARSNAPCIIFIDEIDAVGAKRSSESHGHNEHGSTLNKLLSEMDGFTSNDGLMVVGATNRIETLDDALLRSGRFDKQIFFDPPNVDERRELFNLFVSKIQLDGSFKSDFDDNLKRLARATAGLTGADIKNICNQSVRLFMNRINLNSDEFKNSGVIYKDLASAIDVVMIGIEKPERKMTEKEREIVSYHEAGHSLMAYMLSDTDVPIKVSIIPRGRSALGFSQQEPSDRKIHTKSELIARLCVLLGGRLAEKLIFGHYSTGASDDIEKVTSLAYSMVTNYGMTDEVGPFNPTKISKNISDSMRNSIDSEAQVMIADAEQLVFKYLSAHTKELTEVAQFLLEREVLLAEDMDGILTKYNIKNKYSV